MKPRATHRQQKKAAWQAIRARYTWYLRPPFDSEFDRTHWWKGQQHVEPIAAVYELVRRHPLVGEEERIAVSLPGSPPPIPLPSIFEPLPSLKWTRRLRMKPWTKLTAAERKEWTANLGQIRGLDFRPEGYLCMDITSLARLAIEQNRADAHKAVLESGPPYFPYYPPEEPTDWEWKEAFGQCGLAAHRQGRLLIALAPDLSPDKAAALVAAAYRKHVRAHSLLKRRERSRGESWLGIIEEFENDEASGQGAKAQVFAHYRRVVDGIRFR